MPDRHRFHEHKDLLRCKFCGITEEETTMLQKCPMCFTIFCPNCGYSFGGRQFCSKSCADYFYFGEGDEEG
ncbi:MAG: hypothetical protein GXO69_05185 [Acidobacteria bacterium]|nr:hypothetical protein [Acidobacteriota bacterium]